MSLYGYRAPCKSVVDGDTVDLEYVDQGFGHRMYPASTKDPLRFRLAGVDAYETTLRDGTTAEQKQKGLAAKAWLTEQISGKTVRFRSVKSDLEDAFGRYLVFLFRDGPDEEVLDPSSSINRELLDKGFAVVSKYPDGDLFAALGYQRKTA